MTMNGNTLGDAMFAAANIAGDPTLNATEKNELKAKFRAIYGATVVSHITTYAQLAGLIVSVTSVSGVTPGGGTSGPGAGTATGNPGSIT